VLQHGGMGTLSERTAAPLPTPGCLVHCRSHHHLVEQVWPPEEDGRDTVVRLAWLDDDANGQIIEVFWERVSRVNPLGRFATTKLAGAPRGTSAPTFRGAHEPADPIVRRQRGAPHRGLRS
jgi:hypothetical protein